MTDVAKDLTCESVEEGDFVSRYVTDQLPEADAEAFERHYLGCDRCSAEIQTALELRAAMNPLAGARAMRSQGIVSIGFRRQLLALAAVFAIGAIATVIWLQIRSGGSRSEGSLEALARDTRQESPVAVRLSGPLLGSPAPKHLRGEPSELSSSRSTRLERDATRAIDEATENHSAGATRAAGVAALLINRPTDAVRLLEGARLSNPGDPEILTDLSAAYILNRNPQKALERAKEAADLAKKADRRDLLAAALFNAALAWQALPGSDLPSIESAWSAYLALDNTSTWAELARTRLDEARRKHRDASLGPSALNFREIIRRNYESEIERAVRSNPEEARRFLEDELLATWGRDYLAGSPDARIWLGAAHLMASNLVATNGEALSMDTVRCIEKSLTRPTSAETLARGHAAYGEGRLQFQRREMESALDSFRTAQRYLGDEDSPFRHAARMEIAACLYNQNAYGETTQLTVDLQRDLDARRRYIALRARAAWLKGLLETFAGDQTKSLAAYEEAVRGFERLHERRHAAFLHGLIADSLDYLGQPDEASAHRDIAFELLPENEASEWRHQIVGAQARAALENAEPRLAVTILSALLQHAQKSENTIWECDAYRWRALAQQQAGNPDLASSDILNADAAAGRITDSSIRARSQADVDLAAATVWRKRWPSQAERRATAALAFFQGKSVGFSLARCLAERGRIRLDRGETEPARKDLAAAVDDIELQRGRVADEWARISYFDSTQSIFDDLIGLLVSNGQEAASFEYAERARARALLDDFGAAYTEGEGPVARPLSLDEVLKRSSPDVALVEYRLLETRTVIWVIRGGRLTTAVLNQGRQTVEALAGAAAAGFRRGQGFQGSASLTRSLSETLIRPVEPLLVNATAVVFVPDGALAQIPFAALRSSLTDRLLVEDYAVAASPSVSFLTQATVVLKRPSHGGSRKTLLIGNPALDPSRFPGLDIPLAGKEVAQIAALFPQPTVLLGAEATKARFLALAPQSSVVHFAGHAVVNIARPQFSTLLLAPDSGSHDDGALTAAEIARARFPGTRFVSLAACGTADGSRSDSEGAISLARAFLAAGIPSVLATLWPVEDSEAATVSVRVLSRIASGEPPIVALRQAQLEQLQHPAGSGASYTWAAFELLGPADVSLEEEKEDS